MPTLLRLLLPIALHTFLQGILVHDLSPSFLYVGADILLFGAMGKLFPFGALFHELVASICFLDEVKILEKVFVLVVLVVGAVLYGGRSGVVGDECRRGGHIEREIERERKERGKLLVAPSISALILKRSL
jgi:hypothetical protein